MEFLEFASGPAFYTALVIFVVGVGWRLGSLVFMKRRVDLSEPRDGSEKWKGLWMIASRSINHGPVSERIKLPIANAYLMHMLLFVVLFLAQGHIDLIRENFGIGWPHLPELVIRITSFALLLSLAITYYRRLSYPVLKLLSNFDDWFSLIVTTLPVITGLLLAYTAEPKDSMLAWHIMTFNLLLIWFPFGKLMHAFLIFGSRYATGVWFAHKGARL